MDAIIQKASMPSSVPYFLDSASLQFSMTHLTDTLLEHMTYSATIPAGTWSMQENSAEDIDYVWYIPKDAHVQLTLTRFMHIKKRSIQIILSEGAKLQLDCMDYAHIEEDNWTLQLGARSQCIFNHAATIAAARLTKTTVDTGYKSSFYYHTALYVIKDADFKHSFTADVINENVFIQHNIHAVLLDTSRASLESLVHLYPESKGVKTIQNMKTFLLSQDASIMMIPDLVIDHNEVEASHGACSGMIDPEWLRYAKTRGLSEEVLRSLYSLDFLLCSLHKPGTIMQEFLSDYLGVEGV